MHNQRSWGTRRISNYVPFGMWRPLYISSSVAMWAVFRGMGGFHLNTSRKSASTYGKDALSSKFGRREPTTWSISCCAFFWAAGNWDIARKNARTKDVVYIESGQIILGISKEKQCEPCWLRLKPYIKYCRRYNDGIDVSPRYVVVATFLIRSKSRCI